MKKSECIFSASDIKKIGAVLGVKGKAKGNNVRFEIIDAASKRHIALELYSGIKIGNSTGNLVTVYTPSAHLQLHYCSGYVVSSVLGEVTFVGECHGRLSGIIIEKEGGCSLYANVARSLLSGDFTQLGPEVMMSGIALSLTESILPEAKMKKTKKGKLKK